MYFFYHQGMATNTLLDKVHRSNDVITVAGL